MATTNTNLPHRVTTPGEMQPGYVYRTRDPLFISAAFQEGYVVIQHPNSPYTVILPEKCPTNHGLSTGSGA